MREKPRSKIKKPKVEVKVERKVVHLARTLYLFDGKFVSGTTELGEFKIVIMP